MSKDVTPDFGRVARTGVSEAVFCDGKTAGQVAEALARARERDVAMLLTRLTAGMLAALPEDLRAAIDYDPLSRTGFFGDPEPLRGEAACCVVSAGTSDLAVANEAARTLRFHGEACAMVSDVGVAGLWRLTERLDEIRRYPVAILVAGMDGAMFSVAGGLLPGVLVAVPVSTGYGAAEGGRTALNSALCSCAPGLASVNIDNGFGGACAALRALSLLRHATTPDAAADKAFPVSHPVAE